MKSVAIAFCRLNPPTTGHLRLIEVLNDQPTDKKYLFLSHSSDPRKNPLSYPVKLDFVRRLFGLRFPKIEMEEAPYRTVIEVLAALNKENYDEVTLVAGGDRVEDFQKLVNAYNGKPDLSGNILYSFTSINVVSAGERDPDAEDVSGMSASKMRGYAAADNFEGFRAGIPTDDDSLAREIFVAVRRGMKYIERVYRMTEAPRTPANAARLKKRTQQKSAAVAAKRAATDTGSKDTADDVAAKKETAAEFKKVTDNKQAEETKKGGDAYNNFASRAKNTPADGGLSRITEDLSQAWAQMLVVLADPVTKYHAAVIDQFVRAAPTKLYRQTARAGTKIYKIIAVVSSKSDIIDNVGVRALWVRDLVASTKSTLVVFGKVEAIARLLAGRFGYLEFVAQGRVHSKTSALIAAEWNRAKGSPAKSTAFAARDVSQLGITTNTFDDPNSAQDALATVDKKLISDISAFKKQVEDGSAIATDLEKQIDAITDKRKKAFIEELPRGKDISYLEAIYFAFCAKYKEKTGKSIWDLFKSVFASELEATKELGEEVGVTQAVQAVGKVKQFLSSNSPTGGAGTEPAQQASNSSA